MKLRCELHLDHRLSRVILVAKPEEKFDHLALKLAAFVMFDEARPVVDPSTSHASLAGLDVRPDLLITDEGGGISHWIECGTTSLNKLDKVARRLPSARVIVIQSTERSARQLRERLQDETKHDDRIEIWTWTEDSFNTWQKALAEKTEIFGEARERSFNLVVNETAYHAELIKV